MYKINLKEAEKDDLIGQVFNHPIYGDYIILDRDDNVKSRKYLIHFINTGYEKFCYKKDVIAGKVKDYTYPAVFGVAKFGEPKKYNCYSNPNYYRIYAIWHAMISRCYNPKDKEYIRYGAKGIKVCDRWLCFENFYIDFINMNRYEEWASGDKLNLDKDFLQQDIPPEQRIYSPETCVLIEKEYNINLMNKEYKIASGQSCSDYIGVRNTFNGKFAVELNKGNKSICREITFTNPYYAAIYRDYLAKANYMIPMNNVPIDDKSYFEALNYRSMKQPYKPLYKLRDDYNPKQLYKLVDNNS